MAKLIFVVPASRAYCGRGLILSKDGSPLFGPFRALATASVRVARKRGNASCDPLRPFGHTPTGGYVVAGSLPPGRGHPRRPTRFGAVGALILSPTSGQALASLENGRTVFPIHGGPLDDAGRLMPTRGGVRLSDADMEGLLRAVNAAHLARDPLSSIEIVDAAPSDVSAVRALDLRGVRRRRGAPSGALSGVSGSLGWMAVLGLGAGLAGRKQLNRRAVLQAALLLVGGLSASSCNQAGDECHPCETGRLLDGGLDDSGLVGGLDAGTPTAHCHKKRYVCTDTSGAVFYSDVDLTGTTDTGDGYDTSGGSG